MKKTILAACGAAFLGIVLAPTPASALIPFPFMMAILESKKDPNFKAVNPYDKKATRRGKKSRR
jgi:hypothetical protein